MGAVPVTQAAAPGIAWMPLNLLYVVIAVVSGGVISVALNLFTASSAFWIIESVPATKIVFSLHKFARYPLSIYHRGIRLLLTWLIRMAARWGARSGCWPGSGR